MLKSSLCNCSDAYVFVSGTIKIDEEGVDNVAKRWNEREKEVMFKN